MQAPLWTEPPHVNFTARVEGLLSRGIFRVLGRHRVWGQEEEVVSDGLSLVAPVARELLLKGQPGVC